MACFCVFYQRVTVTVHILWSVNIVAMVTWHVMQLVDLLRRIVNHRSYVWRVLIHESVSYHTVLQCHGFLSDLVCWLVKNRQLLFHLIQSFQGVLIYCSNWNKYTTEINNLRGVRLNVFISAGSMSGKQCQVPKTVIVSCLQYSKKWKGLKD